MRSIFLTTARGLGLAVALCGTQTTHAQKDGGTLHLVGMNPPSASIHEEYTVDVQRAFMPVFNNLVLFDQSAPHHTAKTIKPDLAESWSWDPTHTILTFKLHPGVKWHDGQAFTANDVKCTWDTLRGARNAGWRSNPRGGWYSNLKDVTVDNDLQVSFHLAHPQPSLLLYLASGLSPVYPCHVSAQKMRTLPVGTGPFKVVSFDRGQSVTLVKNPHYFKKGLPHLDGATVRLVAGGSSINQELGFTSGLFDHVILPPERVKEVQKNNPTASCEVIHSSTQLVLVMNLAKAPFDDVNIRRAFAYAIDRSAFVKIGNGAFEAGELFSPNSEWGRPMSALTSFPGYNPDVAANIEKARALMRQAGYGPEKPLSIHLITRNSSSYIPPTTLLADQLSKIYVKADIQLLESKVWYATRSRKDFQVAVDVAGTAVDDPDDYLSRLTCGSPLNASNYCDKKVGELMQAQSRELDEAKRKELVTKISDILMQDAVRPTLYHKGMGFCTKSYVKGLTIADNGGHFNSWRLEDVQLDKSAK
ncbi:ABC transporter substrate-binding protein [Candidimonas nitroreducens]|uniref:Peptide ABC transporter substrate-binding protein n=1 Tax=Candidimonas nitroreducens TaxID=683354 RepID=A0A225MFD7_9BURK|nr:ABC transporter substrate-binding protein [Candidimonas nitroreducens]OWT58973.1 peptide ABC transporter substrate-binding protein [Candidimonas nitroreducens]